MAKEIIIVEDLETFRLRLLEDLKQIVQHKIKIRSEGVAQERRSPAAAGDLAWNVADTQNEGSYPCRKLGGIMFYRYQDVIDALETDPKIGQV